MSSTEEIDEMADEMADAAILSAARWNLYDLASGSGSGAAYYAHRDFKRLSIAAQQRLMRDVAALIC